MSCICDEVCLTFLIPQIDCFVMVFCLYFLFSHFLFFRISGCIFLLNLHFPARKLCHFKYIRNISLSLSILYLLFTFFTFMYNYVSKKPMDQSATLRGFTREGYLYLLEKSKYCFNNSIDVYLLNNKLFFSAEKKLTKYIYRERILFSLSLY